MGVEFPGGAGGGSSKLAARGGHAGADVPLPATTPTVVLTTTALPVGTHVFSAQVTVANGNAAATICEIEATLGTATATFDGARSSELELPAVAGNCGVLTVDCIVTVTVAGTITVTVTAQGGVSSTAKASTPQSALPDATGWTAIQTA